MKIVTYQSQYEKSWVYCKALAYLYSDFFDDRSLEKDLFDSDIFEDRIELVALDGEMVIGLLDIAIYNQEMSNSYKYHSADKVAYFANLAVRPDFQNQGIATALFEKAEELLKEKAVQALSIFTRGDANANHLYQKWGAELICRDFLVVGTLKNQEGFVFDVDKDEKRLRFTRDGRELPYYQREGIYVVAKEEDIALFDCDEVYEERTYLKRYDKS